MAAAQYGSASVDPDRESVRGMTNPKDGTVDGGERERPKAPRRRPATIELEATEIASDPVPDPSQEVAMEAAREHPAEGDDSPSAAKAATAAPSSPPAGPAARSPRWRFVAAFAAGAAITALAAAALWGGGILSARLAPDHAPALAAQLAALDRRIDALAARPVASQPAPGLEARLAALEAARSSPPLPPPPPAPDATLARIEALEQRLNEVATREAPAAPANIASETPTASGENRDLEALTARVAALEQRLREVQSTTAPDHAVRLGLAAMELRLAVERGSPFAAELAVLSRLVDDPSALAPLKPTADTGVPAPAALAQTLSKLTPAMLKVAGPPGRDAGVLDRLQAGAERLVRIRRIEDTPGDDPATMIARAEVKAARGDIAGAVAEIDQLPDPVRAPAAGWIDTARARLAALDAARRLCTHALQALGPVAP